MNFVQKHRQEDGRRARRAKLYANFVSRPSGKSRKQSITSKGHECKEKERERETGLQRDLSFLAQIPRRSDIVSPTFSSIAVSLARNDSAWISSESARFYCLKYIVSINVR